MSRLVEAGVAGLARLFADGAVRPTDACEAHLEAIAAHDGALRSYVHVDAEGARRAAQHSADRWRAGCPRSRIDGIPVAVKANIAVAGFPWHAGIAAYRGRVAARDAACVTRLREAGVVVLGLANMHEGALGGTTDNAAFGRTHNPWRHGWTAGGSSGGSAAAVAAGLCAAALGTDTLGSVRIPSAYCGVFGHKPARGWISRDGVVPLSPSLDEVGVHARSAEDCAWLMAVLTGAVPTGAVQTGRDIVPQAAAARVAVLDVTGQVKVCPATSAALAEAADRAAAAGLSIERLRLDLDYGRLRRAALLLLERDAQEEHAAAMLVDPDGFTRSFTALLAWGKAQPDDRVQAAGAMLAAAAALLRQQVGRYAAVLAPTVAQPAFAFSAPMPTDQADLTAPASIAGLAACACPIGFADGLPLSMQVIASTDEACMDTVAAYSRQGLFPEGRMPSDFGPAEGSLQKVP